MDPRVPTHLPPALPPAARHGQGCGTASTAGPGGCGDPRARSWASVRWSAVPISERELTEGEEVLVDVHPHWVALAAPLIVTVAAAAVAAAVVNQFPHAPAAVGWVLAVMVLVPAAWLGVRFVRWVSVSLVVTTQRVMLRRGVLRRDVTQVRLQRISEVHCTQSLWDRMIGIGRLVLELYSDEENVVVDDVRRPRSLQRVINAQLDVRDGAAVGSAPADGEGSAGPARHPTGPHPDPSDDGGPSTPPQGVPAVAVVREPTPAPPPPERPPSLHQQLLELDDLRRRGILTEGEFQVKKSEVLRRM